MEPEYGNPHITSDFLSGAKLPLTDVTILPFGIVQPTTDGWLYYRQSYYRSQHFGNADVFSNGDEERCRCSSHWLGRVAANASEFIVPFHPERPSMPEPVYTERRPLDNM